MDTNKAVVEGSSVTFSQLKELGRQIFDGELTSSEIQAIIERRNPFKNPHRVPRQPDSELECINGVPVYLVLRIKLGTFKSSEELRRAVQDKRRRLGQEHGHWNDQSLDRIPVCTKEEEVELVCISLNEYPRSDTEQFVSICTNLEGVQEWGRSLGLGICPAEVGPQLYLQYVPVKTLISLSVVMEPVLNSTNQLRAFEVMPERATSKDENILGGKNTEYYNEDMCVFMRPIAGK